MNGVTETWLIEFKQLFTCTRSPPVAKKKIANVNTALQYYYYVIQVAHKYILRSRLIEVVVIVILKDTIYPSRAKMYGLKLLEMLHCISSRSL